MLFSQRCMGAGTINKLLAAIFTWKNAFSGLCETKKWFSATFSRRARVVNQDGWPNCCVALPRSKYEGNMCILKTKKLHAWRKDFLHFGNQKMLLCQICVAACSVNKFFAVSLAWTNWFTCNFGMNKFFSESSPLPSQHIWNEKPLFLQLFDNVRHGMLLHSASRCLMAQCYTAPHVVVRWYMYHG